MFLSGRERTIRWDQREYTLDCQFVQSGRSISHPNDSGVLSGGNSGRIVVPATLSFPDTSHAITSDNLFQPARVCVPNLHKLAREEENEWVVIGNTFSESFPFYSDTVAD